MTEDESSSAAEESAARTSRRGFLTGAAGLTGVALGVAEWKPAFADEEAGLQVDALAARRGFVSGKYGLELDGIGAGFIKSVEGGSATSDVITEKLGPTGMVMKHIGSPKYEDLTISAGTGMSKQFYSWISDSVSSKPVRHSGAIVGVDFGLRELTRLTFFNGLLTEVGMPALDAASKDACKMTVKFSPEWTRQSVNFGRPPGPPIKPFGGTQKQWLPANFRLDIRGLDCTRVNKIEAIVIKLEQAGSDRAGGLQKIDIPNLKLTLLEAAAADFFSWHEDFVIKGNNSREQERTGHLSYLAADLKTELFRLDLFGLGIFALDRDPFITGQEPVRHVTAQFYCDQMVFSVDGGGKT